MRGEGRKSWCKGGWDETPAGRGSSRKDGGPGPGSRGPHPHQVVASMFGLEHLGHLAEVAPEVLLIGCAGEGDGDDPLGDIHQVQLTAVLRGPACTHVSGETVDSRSESRSRTRSRKLHPSTPYMAPRSNPGGLGCSLTPSQGQRLPWARPV